MQQALRPYATAGIALVSAGMIAVTPVAAPPMLRDVQLTSTSPWTDLFTETAANLQNIINGADSQAITSVFESLFTNPLGVLGALTNLTPTVTTDLSSIPAQISVELPPGLELGIAQLGAEAATLNAVNDVVGQLTSDPSAAFTTLLNAPAVIANAYLNGQDNVSLLDGIINIPAFNGILAPLQSMEVNLNLTDLVNALGLGNLGLSNLDLSSLLSQLGLGNLTLGGLFSDLGLSNDGLGTLLADGSNVTTLGGLLSLLGLNGLGVGSLSLTGVLSGLGLDTNVDLNSLTLDSVLGAFGINPNVNMGLDTLLTNLGFGTFLNTGLGDVLPLSELQNILTQLNDALYTLLSPFSAITAALQAAGLKVSSLLDVGNVATALDTVPVAQLLGGQTLNESLSNILTALGVNGVTPSGLTIGGLLHDLGFSSATGNLTLSQLLGDLGNPILGLNITDLLNSLNLGGLLGDLGLSNLPLNLSNLGDLSGLTLDGLLGDLGLGDLANVTVDPFGGFITELVDVVPQQILAALGM